MRIQAIQKAGLALLAAAALFGAAQMLFVPSTVGAQTAPDGSLVASSSTVSATGVAQVAVAQVDASSALMVSLEERTSGTDVQSAVKAVQERIAKLRATLKTAGIPDAAIHL